MLTYNEVLVVGGGIAGMTCARILKEADRDVAIVTDELGGRICYDHEYDCNFGAIFFMDNYAHSRKLLKEKKCIKSDLGAMMLHTSPQKEFKGNSLTMIASVPQLNKFRKFMNNEFIPEYNAYKKDCETMPVSEAFKRHPTIERYFHMKASDVIKELGVGRICDNFISKFAYACTGSKLTELNALDFLNVAQGVVIPIYDFSFDAESFKGFLDGKVYLDDVVRIERSADRWQAIGKNGDVYESKYLVVATPGLVTQKLLHIDEVRQPTRLITYLVRGKQNAWMAKARQHYFGDRFDIICTSNKGNDMHLVFANSDIDLSDYFDEWEIVKYRDWPQALFTYGESILKQDFDENLWVAGDLNGLGLEPAAISGVYAANRILEESKLSEQAQA